MGTLGYNKLLYLIIYLVSLTVGQMSNFLLWQVYMENNNNIIDKNILYSYTRGGYKRVCTLYARLKCPSIYS